MLQADLAMLIKEPQGEVQQADWPREEPSLATPASDWSLAEDKLKGENSKLLPTEGKPRCRPFFSGSPGGCGAQAMSTQSRIRFKRPISRH